VNNSPTSISSVTLLATETSSKTYIMQSCDFSGGAWFRTTNEEEEHAFYDPDTNQLYKNNGNIATRKLVSVANSRRGHYFTFFWDTSSTMILLMGTAILLTSETSLQQELKFEQTFLSQNL
jgi:hypothetical protein